MNRIKKYIKSFTTILLSMLVLFSTSGLTIYNHHCNSNKTNYYSLFLAIENGNIHEHEPLAKSCCELDDAIKQDSNCTLQVENDETCCTNFAKVIKLDTQTLLNHSTPSLKLNEIQSNLFIAFFDYYSLKFHPIVNQTLYSGDLALPLSTPEYLALIQVYII
jgi:hypothetical protein